MSHKIQQIHVWALPSVVWNPGKFAQLVVVILWQSYAALDQPDRYSTLGLRVLCVLCVEGFIFRTREPLQKGMS